MDQPLIFLLKLAWACRYRLPLLITIGFMALDIRMQLEIHIQMRRIHRGGPPLPLRGGRRNNTQRNRTDSDDSSDSWLTIDEDDFAFEQNNASANLNGSLASTSTAMAPKMEVGQTNELSALNQDILQEVQDNLLDVNLIEN